MVLLTNVGYHEAINFINIYVKKYKELFLIKENEGYTVTSCCPSEEEMKEISGIYSISERLNNIQWDKIL